MDRWSTILKVPLHPDSITLYRVAASLCLSPSTKTLTVPSANVVFFNGDRVEDTGNPVIERLSDLQKIGEVLVSKFGSTINAWVVEAPIFNGPFAIFKDFIPSVNENGEPKAYDATGFPASSAISLLLSNCLNKVKSSVMIDQKEHNPVDHPASCSCKPKTFVLGFSKGGTVLNQLITELGSVDFEHTESETKEMGKGIHVGRATRIEDHIIPSSREAFLNSIAEIHYVDVGLNSEGAYLTDKDAIERLSECIQQRDLGIRILVHGTPRQWNDSWRIWIRKEKNELLRLLKRAAIKNTGKLTIRERLYFAGWPSSLQMHFEIIENLDVS